MKSGLVLINRIGFGVLGLMDSTGNFGHLVLQTTRGSLTAPFRVRDTIRQFYFMANQSLIIVVVCVSFAAMVTIIEAAFHMKLVVQNDEMVPGFAAILILRELGVVLAGLLVTSRVGAGIAAEVGSMAVTEQIDALTMLGIDPIRYLVVPRFVACVFGGVILSIVSNMVCLTGAYFVSAQKLGYSYGSFVAAMTRMVSFQDLVFAMVKGACFGAIIPLVSCYYGFRCKAGAEGVGQATTNSVVTTTVAIIIFDFILSFLFSHFY